ncbi:unnamed protein product [Pelagomonas calceolata]|uniref:Uncharacterized protein n=1 Tax=Pelagomonas calceolata TaxID=35677 RepID=A0A7S3ZUP9_9STRA|nr:unnamed protein product [Pelagomonas calceolata]|mmetsp:Transcript_1885/g.5545  ORF Transcript_1885/g.5545 Transcript_1885/m.5545 type:complete len:491 (+) Transcript_1885:129-1601(+)
MQLAALLLLCIAQIDAKPRGLGPAGRDYILSVLPQAEKLGTLSEATIEVPAATDGSTLAQQVRALDAQAARRIQERDARQAARKARETQRAVARTFNALSEEPVLAPVADEDEDEEVVVEEPVPTEILCVLCREAKLGKQGCAALLRLASRQGVVTEIGIADARIDDGGLETLLEWALCRGGRRLRVKRDACGHCDLAKLKRMNATATLEVLELEHLGLEDISGLADLLTPHASSLKRLSLRGNARICDAGIVALAKAFVRTASALEVLDLRNTGCSDGGAVALARALKARRDAGLPNVAVDVGENLLSAKGANDLMRECAVLDLRRNDLQGARLSLKNAPHLKTLSVASCAFTPLDGEAFLKQAAKSSIEVLDLSGNALTTVEAKRRAAKKNPKVVQKLAKITSKVAPQTKDDGPSSDALSLCARLLRSPAKFPSLQWLGLQDVGLTPSHRGLVSAALKKRRKTGGSSIVLEAIANNAAKAPKSKGPQI